MGDNMAETELISHYTDLNGFMGIVQNQCFWASDVTYMNDIKEIFYVLEVIDGFDAKRKDELFGSHKNAIDGLLRSLKEETPQEYKTTTGIHAISFCEVPDSLSQWRGYAAGRQGVSLVFRKYDFETWVNSILEKRGKDSAAKILNVPYIDEENIEEATKKIIELYDNGDFLNSSKKHSNVNNFFTWLISKKKRDQVMEICAQFKHKGFEDEREVRCLILKPQIDLSFRVSGNTIIPYIELKHENEKLPLLEVYVGPSPHQSLIANGVHALLERCGFRPQFEGHPKNGASVTIRLSRIPYRGNM